MVNHTLRPLEVGTGICLIPTFPAVCQDTQDLILLRLVMMPKPFGLASKIISPRDSLYGRCVNGMAYKLRVSS